MERYKEIKERIRSHYNSLPKNQKKIADYFVDNFDRIPFLSVNDISEATSLSVASIVRFSQRVGFKGFLGMRAEIADTLQTRIQNKEIFSLIDDRKLEADILTSVAKQEIKNINETLNLVDRKNFNSVIDLILNSEKVFTLGLGISYLLAQILSYQLNQVAVKSFTFTNNYASFMEQILLLGKNDMLISFSFPPYSRGTVDAAKFANEKGIKVAAITNKTNSPITFYTDVDLIVSSENMLYTNSLSAISVLINAIGTECALKNKIEANKMLDNMNQITKIHDKEYL